MGYEYAQGEAASVQRESGAHGEGKGGQVRDKSGAGHVRNERINNERRIEMVSGEGEWQTASAERGQGSELREGR